MKDLITTMGSLLILSIFVMQFCTNQIIASKILIADSIADKIEKFDDKEIEKSISKFANCFDCSTEDVQIEKEKDGIVIRIPIYDVVACGDFLGIPEDENKSMYVRKILSK